jgi:hypothetical protein
MSDLSQFTDIISLLDATNKTLQSPVFIPSLGNEFIAQPLNANHTKNIVKTTVEGPFAENQFTLIMYNVLSDVFGSAVDLATVNLYDKMVMLIQLRARNISDEYKLTLTSPEGVTKEKIISLTKIVDKLKKATKPDINIQLEVDGYIFVLNIPSIKENFQFENFLYQDKLSKVDESNHKQMKGLVAPIFLSHTTPFITSFTIGDNTIDMTKRNVAERIAIVEHLSAKAITKIIETIDASFGEKIQNATKVTKTIDGVSYTGNIEINAGFFIS